MLKKKKFVEVEVEVECFAFEDDVILSVSNGTPDDDTGWNGLGSYNDGWTRFGS